MVRKKTTKQKLEQLDIVAAMHGKDVIVEKKTEEVLTEKKTISIFDFIKDIRIFKQGNLLDEEQNLSSFVPYMIFRGLSMKESELEFCNFLAKYMQVLDKKELYQLLIACIEKDPRGFYKWIKSDKENNYDSIKYISNFFKCSEKEAQEHLELMGAEWAEKVKEKFGDFELE
jgi:hypothetical protein